MQFSVTEVPGFPAFLDWGPQDVVLNKLASFSWTQI